MGIPTSAESTISWLRIRRTLPLGSGKAAMPSNALGTVRPSLTDDASPPELRRTQRKLSGISSSGESTLLTSSPYSPLNVLSTGSSEADSLNFRQNHSRRKGIRWFSS